jgi:hypothetical protein
MKKSTLLLSSAVSVLGVSSCGFFSDYKASELAETRIRAQCHYAFDCCTAGEWERANVSGDLTRFRSESECVDELIEEGTNSTVYGYSATAIDQAVSAGRFTFDYAKAEECLSPEITPLEDCTVREFLNRPYVAPDPTCAGIPGVGTVADGAACYFDFECAAPGSRCVDPETLKKIDLTPDDPDPKAPTVIAQVLVCQSPIADKKSCEGSVDRPLKAIFCEPGASCIFDGADQECRFNLAEGKTCDFSIPCDVGLYCDDKCKVLKEDGKACDDGSQCQSGECVNDKCFTREFIYEICNGIQGAEDTAYPSAG